MFDIGLWEFVALGVIALVVFGPDRLPKVAADAARLLRQLRAMATGARRELSDALGPELSELSNLTELDPRRFVRKNLFDAIDDDAPSTEAEGERPSRRSNPDGDDGRRAAFDPDTT